MGEGLRGVASLLEAKTEPAPPGGTKERQMKTTIAAIATARHNLDQTLSSGAERRSGSPRLWASACVIALLSQGVPARGQQVEAARDTNLLQWYRDSVKVGEPAAALQPDETAMVTRSRVGSAARDTGRHGGDQWASGGPSFDVREFEAQIHQRMDDKAIGFSYAINFQKQLYVADGWGRERNSHDGIGWHNGLGRMNIASISKTHSTSHTPALCISTIWNLASAAKCRAAS